MRKALGLFSGGLDSILSALIIKDLGFEVELLFIDNGFYQNDLTDYLNDRASEIGVPLTILKSTDHFTANVLDVAPKHLFGKGHNPCSICHSYFINQAHEYMLANGFDFIFSGEVLGQRPNSQTSNMLKIVDDNHSIGNLLLRPLSANLLPDTDIVLKGFIDKSSLYSLSGRSRAAQLEMIKKYPNVTRFTYGGGGCLLTDKSYGHRYKAFKQLYGAPSSEELPILKYGRNFKISENCLVTISRTESETKIFEDLFLDKFDLIEVNGKGPIMIVPSDISDQDLKLALEILTPYCKSDAPIFSRRKNLKIDFDRSKSISDNNEYLIR